jgi:hypothetical protein
VAWDLLPVDAAASIFGPNLPEHTRIAVISLVSMWSGRKYGLLKARVTYLEAPLSPMFPLEHKSISGYSFGQRTWYSSRHLGVDYAAVNASLTAPFNGTVVWSGYGIQGGWMVYFRPDHDNVIMRFMHLKSIDVRSGRVSRGQRLAVTGNSGALTTGPHLHLDISRQPAMVLAGNLSFEQFLDPEQYNWDFQVASASEERPRFRKIYDGFHTDLPPSQEKREEVGRVQDYLVDKGFMEASVRDAGRGYYGPKTQAAVDRFQKAHGIKASAQYYGWWYPNTRQKANENLGIDW